MRRSIPAVLLSIVSAALLLLPGSLTLATKQPKPQAAKGPVVLKGESIPSAEAQVNQDKPSGKAQPSPKSEVPLAISGDTILVINSLPFNVTAPEGADLYFWSYPRGVVATDNGSSLQVTTAPQGTFVVSLKTITVDWTNHKLLTGLGQINCTLGVLPQPPQPPPQPDDPLTQQLQTVYNADGDFNKATLMPKLAQVYQYTASIAGNYKTVGDLYAAMDAKAKALGVAGTLREEQILFGKELIAKGIPSNSTNPGFGYDPVVAQTQFNRFANIIANIRRGH